MASKSGRKLKLKRNGTVIAGLRTKSFNIASEPIDVTTDDEESVRHLLTDDGELVASSRSIDISFDGITKDETLIAIAATGTGLLEDHEIELPWGGSIAGDFALTSLELTGEHEDAVTNSGTLQSAGPWVYTPPA